MNLESQLRLVCKMCRWRPAENITMGVVRAHADTEHPSEADRVELDLVPICRCGSEMALTSKRPTGGGNEKHWFTCPACEASGFLLMRAGSPPPDTLGD